MRVPEDDTALDLPLYNTTEEASPVSCFTSVSGLHASDLLGPDMCDNVYVKALSSEMHDGELEVVLGEPYRDALTPRGLWV
jgi:hypothetical protein